MGRGKKKKSCSCTVAVNIDTNCARRCLQGRPLAARYVAVRSIMFLRPWQTAAGMFVHLEKKEKRSLTAGKGRAPRHLILCKYSDNIARQYSQDLSPCSVFPRCVASPPAEKLGDANTKGSAEVTKGCPGQALWDFLQGIWKFYARARWLSGPGQSQRDETWMVFLFKSHVPTVTGRCQGAKLGARSSARCSTRKENVVKVNTLRVSAHPADQQRLCWRLKQFHFGLPFSETPSFAFKRRIPWQQLDVFFYFFPPQTRSFWPSLSQVKSLSCVDISLTLPFYVFMFPVYAVFILHYLHIRCVR